MIEERPSVREALRLMQPRKQQEREMPPVIQLPKAVSADEEPDCTRRHALPQPKKKPRER